MLNTIKTNILEILDSIFPMRSDFALVKSLNDDKIASLPKAPAVEGARWITSLFHYKDRRVKAVIWELKYRKNTTTLGKIGQMLYEEIVERMSDTILFDNDAKFILLPVPISTERRVDRGYNQSEYIAKAILENDTGHFLLYAPQWFQKIHETARQSHSHSKQERVRNLAGCFSADPRVENYYIILIDDVVTTGSTLSEARKTLLSAGAKGVYGFTIAH